MLNKGSLSPEGRIPIVDELGLQPIGLCIWLSQMLGNVIEFRIRLEDLAAFMVVLLHKVDESRIPERTWMLGFSQEFDAD